MVGRRTGEGLRTSVDSGPPLDFAASNGGYRRVLDGCGRDRGPGAAYRHEMSVNAVLARANADLVQSNARE